ncbi:hypothetical protein D3C81_1682270 [compost metagenome]
MLVRSFLQRHSRGMDWRQPHRPKNTIEQVVKHIYLLLYRCSDSFIFEIFNEAVVIAFWPARLVIHEDRRLQRVDRYDTTLAWITLCIHRIKSEPQPQGGRTAHCKATNCNLYVSIGPAQRFDEGFQLLDIATGVRT